MFVCGLYSKFSQLVFWCYVRYPCFYSYIQYTMTNAVSIGQNNLDWSRVESTHLLERIELFPCRRWPRGGLSSIAWPDQSLTCLILRSLRRPSTIDCLSFSFT